MSRARLNIFLEPEHAKRLEGLAVHKGLSKSSVLAAALSSYLSLEGGDQREIMLAKRLDRLSRQFERLERDQNILIETVALYVRHYLTVSIPVPEGHQDAARAQGRARYAQFITQLGQQLQRGRGLLRVLEDDGPNPPPATELAKNGDRPAQADQESTSNGSESSDAAREASP